MDTEKKSNGAVIGLVIIILILVIGGIYMWQSNAGTDTIENSTQGETPTESGSITAEDSANLDTLDKDLDGANTNIDAAAINSVQ